MRSRLTALLAIFFMTFSASAQEWRLEVGSGVLPMHMRFWGVSPSSSLQSWLADRGQYIITNEGFYPNVIVSGVYRYKERWEIVLTGDVSWSHHRLVQYAQFGIDPAGKPRYDRSKKTDLGWKDSSPVVSGTVQWRYLWIPYGVVKLYSGFGIGFITGTEYYHPIPSVTLLGIRAGGRHLYGFVESPVGPYATLLSGGIGWTF